MAVTAISGVVLGAMYMLWLAQRLLFGAVKAPHLPLADINLREKAIMAILVVAVFWLGLFPQEAMQKTEVAARQYRQMVVGAPASQRAAEGAAPAAAAPVAATLGSAR
jgi:NADH-quinone oxidoreductase subunit M